MSESKKILEQYQQLVNSNFHEIPLIGALDACCDQGVYIIFSNKGDVLHVGKTNGGKYGINQRLLNHIRNQSSFSNLYMKKNQIILRNWGKFKFIQVESARDRALLEALTAGLLCPAHIGTGEK